MRAVGLVWRVATVSAFMRAVGLGRGSHGERIMRAVGLDVPSLNSDIS